MNYKKKQARDLWAQTLKSVSDLIAVLEEIQEEDPRTAGNEISISDGDGGQIILNFRVDEDSLTVTNDGLKLVFKKDPASRQEGL